MGGGDGASWCKVMEEKRVTAFVKQNKVQSRIWAMNAVELSMSMSR